MHDLCCQLFSSPHHSLLLPSEGSSSSRFFSTTLNSLFPAGWESSPPLSHSSVSFFPVCFPRGVDWSKICCCLLPIPYHTHHPSPSLSPSSHLPTPLALVWHCVGVMKHLPLASSVVPVVNVSNFACEIYPVVSLINYCTVYCLRLNLASQFLQKIVIQLMSNRILNSIQTIYW